MTLGQKVLAAVSLFMLLLISLVSRPALAQSSARRAQQEEIMLKEMLAPAQGLKLAMALEVLRDDKRYIGNTRLPFRSGDQVRFHFLTNDNAYLYLLLLKGTRGTSCMLFPLEETGLDNFFAKGRVAIVPREGALEFDKVSGYEEVGIVCSKEKLDPRQFLEEPSRLSLRKKVFFPVNALTCEGRESAAPLRILPTALPLDASPFQEASALIHDQGSILFAASSLKESSRKFPFFFHGSNSQDANVPSETIFYTLKLLHK